MAHAGKVTKVTLTLFVLLGVVGMAGRAVARDDDDAQEVPIILSGRETTSDPAVVKVERHHGRNGLGECTGTLIAPRYVLTARHCVGSGRLEVIVGANARPARIAVVRTHLPTGPERRSGDIAVLELAEAASVVPIPVNLEAGNVVGLQQARVVGFGLTGARREDGRKRTVEFASRTTSEYVESQQKGVVCYGDSGGPTLGMIDGREQVVAVTSHMTSTRCTNARVRSVRTDRHRAFLMAFVDGSAPAPPIVATRPPTTPTPTPPVVVPPSPQARVEPLPPSPPVVPRLPQIKPPLPLPPPPWPPPNVTVSSGSAHASASSSGGRTRVSVRVDGWSAHAEAHAF